jgi:hypothetical protein
MQLPAMARASLPEILSHDPILPFSDVFSPSDAGVGFPQ